MSPSKGPRRPIVGVLLADADAATIDQHAEVEGAGHAERDAA